MNTLLYILLRRLRLPLTVLIGVYAVSVLGFVLIPGLDDQGQPWRMDFFHAFYFVSFMGSTIGFGEIPYPFTSAQRMWTLVCIYATVIAWLYAIGAMLSLLQDQGFSRLLRTRRFAHQVRSIREPFYLICGFGTTGRDVVFGLEQQGIKSVVIDIDQSRIDALELEQYALPVVGLCADASLPENLDLAGLQNACCLGVLALTNDDNVNLSVSIASKLLYPKRIVVSRSENDTTTANLYSFGTDLVVDPFKQFAEYLGLAAHSPQKHLIVDWLIYPEHRSIASIYKHQSGRWILCGYGRFGQALAGSMRADGTEITLVDPHMDSFRSEEPDSVVGIGTEATTLIQAGVEEAVGIIAGTGNDADNLSIIMTARELNPRLQTVVRQNLDSNELIFKRLKADFVMNPGRTIASRILAHLRTPLLAEFLDQSMALNEVDARELIQRLDHLVGDDQVRTQAFTLGDDTPAVTEWIGAGQVLTLRSLLKSPADRAKDLKCLALLVKRADQFMVEPGELTELQLGDEILFAGVGTDLSQQRWLFENSRTLNYVVTGEEPHYGVLSHFAKGNAP